ncbi:MAG: CHAT domain-containing protein [Pyrinomonadaceae bacterium]
MARLDLPEDGDPAAHQPYTLLISISHGDLRLAKYPLAVGHYDGDTIVHAEKRLDKQLGERLSELFNLYLYPGPEGTAEVITLPHAKPPGALVIGLGDVGEIKPVIVRNGISNVALRYAMAVLNESRNKRDATAAAGGGDGTEQSWVSAAFSTLLLGTYGGNALSIEASLTAIIQGVLRVNEALRSQRLWDKVRIDEVEVVELYEDVALQAARAASYLEQHRPASLAGVELKVKPPYLHPLGQGRTQRPADPYTEGGWWRRIRVTSEKDNGGNEVLRFLALTDRARAEDTLQYTQREFIDELVRDTVASTARAGELATVLFRLLVPNTIKDQTRSEASLLLILDEVTAQYPWEMLAERTDAGTDPLALRMGILRQFQTKNFTANPQPSRGRNALVIGEPKSNQPRLPGARKEAEDVAAVLKAAGYDVGGGALLGADGLEVLNGLSAKGYKILHLAGHGQYVKGKPDESGMILDNGRCLSPAMLENLLVSLPELVFINCCHLGRLDDGTQKFNADAPHALAASVSEKLINMGVKAVVAAGWAVEDKAAAAFARVFYEQMLDGKKFGGAVKEARREAQRVSPTSNTWGAYQCYGNPDFVLERSGDNSESAPPPENRCYSRREYLERLEDIASDTTRNDARGRDALRARLEELERDLPDIWRDGAVLSAFGAAWAALGHLDRAIKSYEDAVNKEEAGAPLSTIEQRANLLVRYADKLRAEQSAGGQNGPAAGAKEPGSLIDKAIDLLKWLLGLGESSERLSLLAGCYKRKATAAQTPRERRRWLEQAKEYYGRAHFFHRDHRGSINPYPALNWLTYRFLLGESLGDDVALFDECKEAARKANELAPSFWNRVTEPDAELLRHLAAGDVEQYLEEIITLYRRAFGTGSTQRELSSVTEQFNFLSGMLSGVARKNATVKKNLDALDKLRATFSSAL